MTYKIKVKLKDINGIMFPDLDNKSSDKARHVKKGGSMSWKRIGPDSGNGCQIRTQQKLSSATTGSPPFLYPASGPATEFTVDVDEPTVGTSVPYDVIMPDANEDLDPIIIIDPKISMQARTILTALVSLIVGILIGEFALG